jgi:hypothetical protein
MLGSALSTCLAPCAVGSEYDCNDVRCAAETNGEPEATKDAVTAALQSHARAQMDYAKFLEGRGDRDAAIERARKSLELDDEASGKVHCCLRGGCCLPDVRTGTGRSHA